MGGGGLRILPHKKWHVWRRDNIERVCRDEREHEEKQRELEVKRRKLEQERRAQKLLLSTKGHCDEQQEHINFFKAEETQASFGDVGKPRKKQISGSDDTLRKHGKLPWYAQTKETKKENSAKEEQKRKRELEEVDPLQHMRPRKEQGKRSLIAIQGGNGEKCRFIYNPDDEALGDCDRRKYLARYERSSTSPRRKNQRRHSVGSESEERANRKLSNRSKKRKHKQCKRDKLIEELRREREEREVSERRRAERLMCG